MSEANAKVVLEAFRLLEAGELGDSWREIWHPEVRVTPMQGWPEPGPFVGREETLRQLDRVMSDWAKLQFEDVKLVAEAGDWVVFTFCWHTRGAASGIEAKLDLALAARVQYDAIIEAHFSSGKESALEAAGLDQTKP